MTKLLLLAAASSLLMLPNHTFAACTQEDLLKKAINLKAAKAAYLQKHPNKTNEILTKFQAIAARYQNATERDDACKAFEELAASLK